MRCCTPNPKSAHPEIFMPKQTPKSLRKIAPQNYRVRIRMYRHGLGDCFLLTFPKADGTQAHVLIDCGIVLGTSDPGVVMNQVAENIKTTTGRKVDVLVITHEHWDHLSGFDENQARKVFKAIEFGALWLAWTEEEGNALAGQLRQEREQKKKAARKAKEAAEKRGLKKSAARMAEVLGFFGARAAGDTGAEEDSGGTAGALSFLKDRCRPTILQTGGKPALVPGVDGVRVYVLGPPQNRDALKKTNPSKGEGYGLGGDTISLAEAFLAAFEPHDERAQPFASSLRQPMKNVARQLAAYAHKANHWRTIDDAWLAIGERLALQLDSATNNTSLVLAFEFEESKDVLLFVGDAQAGNWRSWDSHKWMVKDKGGERRSVTAADLLQRTVFYKVGHHGSHNATLQEKGLDRMTSNRLAAVIPVDTKVAHDVKGWKHMPLPAIRERLEDKCVVVFQSDKEPREKTDASVPLWIDSPEKFAVRLKDKKTKMVKTVRQQPLYTDYFP